MRWPAKIPARGSPAAGGMGRGRIRGAGATSWGSCSGGGRPGVARRRWSRGGGGGGTRRRWCSGGLGAVWSGRGASVARGEAAPVLGLGGGGRSRAVRGKQGQRRR